MKTPFVHAGVNENPPIRPEIPRLKDYESFVYNVSGAYIGKGYISGDWIRINEDYEISANEITEIINFTDPTKPANYYRIP